MKKLKNKSKKYILFVIFPIFTIGFLWYYLLTLQGLTALDFFEKVIGTIFLGVFMSGVVYVLMKKYVK